MDGSVSTLAPIFATAFATQKTFTTLLVGLAAAVGAGISMAFSEALSDTGELTGRGSPWTRGSITGLMTFIGFTSSSQGVAIVDSQSSGLMLMTIDGGRSWNPVSF